MPNSACRPQHSAPRGADDVPARAEAAAAPAAADHRGAAEAGSCNIKDIRLPGKSPNKIGRHAYSCHTTAAGCPTANQQF